jgi:DNA repair protein RecO (recombination protein O)
MSNQIDINAVNLKSSDIGENDRLLKLFSYERGLVTAKIRGVKKAQAKLKYAQEPFCFGKYSLSEGKGSFFIVTGCEANDLFYNLRADLPSFTAAAVMAEYCLIFLDNSPPDTALFKLFTQCLTALCYSGIPSQNVLIYFIVNALRQGGSFGDFSRCSVCGNILENYAASDLLEGGFVCRDCNIKSIKPLPLAAYKTIKFLGSMEIGRLGTIKVDFIDAETALKCLNAFVQNASGKAIKSMDKYIESLYQ